MLQAENAPKMVAAGVSAKPAMAEAGAAVVSAPSGSGAPAATARRVVGANGEKLVVYEVAQHPHALQDLFEILYCAFVILLLLVGVFRYVPPRACTPFARRARHPPRVPAQGRRRVLPARPHSRALPCDSRGQSWPPT